ncbi:kinase [Bacillus sp. AFS076308]|uniref:GHMP family kinase ATP-binding protein n=1 Tax=unclassified Bacillus (in: firmicutes) TaxID=185979 RepID=UPI000BF92A23|nr:MULTISPECIES: kinase [unclassified Bacillus (in: firmicutes)]PFO07453.1 kinase [Bacillus sp. AFS076308]PGV52080.1 kinase [Bacillus sp. AFS037270]
MKLGKGSCNGTFGELVQGIIAERPFLITLPIPSLRSEATFVPEPAVSGIRVVDSKMKAKKAGESLLQLFGIRGGGYLEIHSNIPAGKGLASSSADMVAAVRAIADSYSLPLTNEVISMIAVKVEPTDGVMYEEAVAYDYIHGQLIESFGALPPFILVGIDLGGAVNTIEFNQIPKEYSREDQEQFILAYNLVKKGFNEKNLSYIGQAATISARVNQKILPKHIFPQLDKLAHRFQGGMVVAHSGTVAGILLDGNIPNRAEVISHLLRKMSFLFKGLPIKLFHYGSTEKILV